MILVVGEWLDQVILQVFSNLNVILGFCHLPLTALATSAPFHPSLFPPKQQFALPLGLMLQTYKSFWWFGPLRLTGLLSLCLSDLSSSCVCADIYMASSFPASVRCGNPSGG